MPGCAVFGCGNYSRSTKGTAVKYYRFPKDEILRKRWIDACSRGDPLNMMHGKSKNVSQNNYFSFIKVLHRY